MYTYIHILYIHIHIPTCVYIYIYVYIICVYISIYTHTHTHIRPRRTRCWPQPPRPSSTPGFGSMGRPGRGAASGHGAKYKRTAEITCIKAWCKYMFKKTYIKSYKYKIWTCIYTIS